MLNLAGRVGVVVGSGPVAMRKARALSDAGATVRLVSPDPPAEDSGDVEILAEPYRPEQLAGAFVVFACTNAGNVNSQIAADARRAGALVCTVDQPEDCDFFSPALVRDGDVIVAVGTGGAAPHLARRLADALQAALPEQIGAFADCVGSLRELLQPAKLSAKRRGEILRDLSGEETYRIFLAEGLAAVKRRCETLRNAQGGPPCDSCA